ncbi:MAG: NUDIX hydrolase [Candidatus Saccharibacteria bacterium]
MTQEEWEQSIERAGVVVACLIKNNGKYLLVQERQPDAYGLWNLPAGHVDKDEKLEEAAIREAKEETGLDVNLIKEIAIYHETAKQAIKHVYVTEIIGGELISPNDEIMDIKWLTSDQIKKLDETGKMRRPWVWDIIQKDIKL